MLTQLGLGTWEIGFISMQQQQGIWDANMLQLLVAWTKLVDEHCEVVQVFHLSCPDRDELMRRIRKRSIKENRLDDASDEVIENRIKQYEEETKQLLDHYSPEILTNINAQQTPIKVLQDIIYTVTSLRVWQESSLKVEL